MGGTIPATLKFRFRVTWPATQPANSGIMYGWFVDDVKFIEGYSNDLALESAYALTGEYQLYYSRFAATQAAGGNAETTVSGIVSNEGSATQTATLTATAGAFSGTSAATSIVGFDSDSLVLQTDYTIPATVGVNNITATATAAGPLVNTTDDAATIKFQVTQSVTGVDQFTGTGSSMTGAFTSFVGQVAGELTGIGTVFEIFEDGEIGAVEVGIANITGATNQAPYIGKEYYVSFYRYDSIDDVFVYDSETPSKITVAANFGKIVKFYLTSPVQVATGELILAVATSYVDSEVPFGFSGLIPAGNTFGIVGTADDITGLASDEATPTLVEAPVVRLDFANYLSLNELESATDLSIAPNPFVDATNISFNLKSDAKVSVVVTDLAGRVVATVDAGQLAAGNQTINIDGSSFKAGVYNYTLKVGNSATTKRVVKK